MRNIVFDTQPSRVLSSDTGPVDFELLAANFEEFSIREGLIGDTDSNPLPGSADPELWKERQKDFLVQLS